MDQCIWIWMLGAEEKSAGSVTALAEWELDGGEGHVAGGTAGFGCGHISCGGVWWQWAWKSAPFCSLAEWAGGWMWHPSATVHHRIGRRDYSEQASSFFSAFLPPHCPKPSDVLSHDLMQHGVGSQSHHQSALLGTITVCFCAEMCKGQHWFATEEIIYSHISFITIRFSPLQVNTNSDKCMVGFKNEDIQQWLGSGTQSVAQGWILNKSVSESNNHLTTTKTGSKWVTKQLLSRFMNMFTHWHNTFRNKITMMMSPVILF